ncbi:MAG: hypothetical protein HYY04_01700 [Chloroflexi bacterium]|nr:hypothetical protein [Chloroflexota bacterium]
MRDRVERELSEIEAQQQQRRHEASTSRGERAVEPDVVAINRQLMESFSALAARLDRLDHLITTQERTIQTGFDNVERRIAAMMQQITVFLGVMLVLVLVTGLVTILAR